MWQVLSLFGLFWRAEALPHEHPSSLHWRIALLSARIQKEKEQVRPPNSHLAFQTPVFMTRGSYTLDPTQRLHSWGKRTRTGCWKPRQGRGYAMAMSSAMSETRGQTSLTCYSTHRRLAKVCPVLAAAGGTLHVVPSLCKALAAVAPKLKAPQ